MQVQIMNHHAPPPPPPPPPTHINLNPLGLEDVLGVCHTSKTLQTYILANWMNLISLNFVIIGCILDPDL